MLFSVLILSHFQLSLVNYCRNIHLFIHLSVIHIFLQHKTERIACNLTKKHDGDPKQIQQAHKVTANQVTHQLLLNGTSTKKCQKAGIHVISPAKITILHLHLQKKKLNDGINTLTNEKIAEVDDMCVEHIEHFGPGTKNLLLQLFINCRETFKIPELWKKLN